MTESIVSASIGVSMRHRDAPYREHAGMDQVVPAAVTNRWAPLAVTFHARCGSLRE